MGLQETFWRLAATGLFPRRWALGSLPNIPTAPTSDSRPDRPLHIEIVSHCWRYHRLLSYQLSSLVLHPPKGCRVTMTVFHTPSDQGTVRTLEHFSSRAPPGVEWSWRPLSPGELFRRGIGRNRAALATSADWIWFSDCDVIFHEGALDAAAEVLAEQDAILCFPRTHGVTELLDPEHAWLQPEGNGEDQIVDVDPDAFVPEIRQKAVGGFQIVRGDVARAVGYCRSIPLYQKPAVRWRKTYEDRALRWILGTQGTPVEIPGLYRIRHRVKGRKTGSGQTFRVR